MRTFEQWMDEYSVSHQNPTNQIIHKVCVPFIMLSVLGILWSIPVPAIFLQVPYLNWATIFSTGRGTPMRPVEKVRISFGFFESVLDNFATDSCTAFFP